MTRRGASSSICESMSELRADYGAAKASRYRRKRNLPVNGAGADYHIRDQSAYFTLVEFARDMEHNAPLVRQGIRRLVANCNPGSMTPDPYTGDADVDAHLMKRWWEWSESPRRCHAARKLSFRRMTNVAFGRVVVDGDIFGLPLDAGSIQTHEADRCRTPHRARTRGGVCGVEKGPLGEPQKYWLTKEPYGGRSLTFDDVQPFAAETADGEPNVYHVYNPERFSQSRGISALAPVLDIEGIRDDLEFAQLLKNQVQACQTFAEKLDPTAWQFLNEMGAFEKLKATSGEYFLDQWGGTGAERKTIGIRPGQILPARVPGISYEMFASDIPGEGFFALEKTVLTYLAINLDLPLIVLLLDASDTTFSSYRHVLDQARTTFREILDWFSMQWHRPIWRWQVLRWLEEGDTVLQSFVGSNREGSDALAALLAHDWHGLGERYIEPVKDKTGDAIELSHSLTSRRRWCRWRHGLDWNTLAGEIVDDNKSAILLAIVAAQDIKKQTGVDVDYRELLPFGLPTGVTMQLTETGDAAANETAARPSEAAASNRLNGSTHNRLNGAAHAA